MKIKKIIPLCLVASMILSSCSSTTEEAITETYTAVKTTNINPDTIEKTVKYTGKFEPVEQVSVIAKLSGTVLNSYKNVGDTVALGDALYTVDATDINLAVQQANAQASAASLAVASAENAKNSITGAQFDQSILSLETSIENLETQLKTATDAFNFASTSYNNSKTLYESGVISKVEFDQTELSYNQAKAQVSSLEAQLSQVKQSYELTKNNLVSESKQSADIGIAQAKASANTASLAAQSAAKNLNDVTPTSPISGIVSAKGVTDNQMVGSGTLAYTISNIDEVVATINVTENVINKINLGDKVSVSIQSLDQTVMGTVTEINPIASTTSTYPVKITINNLDHTIKPGMFCEVEIIIEKAENTISIPREAVLRNMNEFYVYVVEDNNAVMKVVTTGIDNGENIEILSGLTNGDNVITEGQTYVSDGEQVNVVE